jgi:PAS domain S-box-containing protein
MVALSSLSHSDSEGGGMARIFVVEDESIVALNLQNRLKNLGYDIAGTAASGEDAIAKCEESRPDLVLMDIMLKGEMDGIAAADQIRNKLRIPVVYLTAYADNVTLDRARITEPFGYILKPFEIKEIRTTVEIALYKHKMEELLRQSEERYALAVSGANDGIWDWDLVTDTVYYSPRWKAILGFTEEEISGQKGEWLDRVHPDEKAELEMAIERHLDGVTSHLEFECRLLAKNGQHRWVFIRGLAVRRSGGKAVRMAGSLTDLTRRHQAEEKLLRMTQSDTLTDLLTESAFLEKLYQAEQSGKDWLIVCISLPDFGKVYSEKGPFHANEILTQIAPLFHEIFAGKICARVFAGQFYVLLEGGDEPAARDRVRVFMESAREKTGESLEMGMARIPAGGPWINAWRSASLR